MSKRKFMDLLLAVVTAVVMVVDTATNLEHRMAVIFKNAGMEEYTGSLHIFRRTFATQMFEDGARVDIFLKSTRRRI